METRDIKSLNSKQNQIWKQLANWIALVMSFFRWIVSFMRWIMCCFSWRLVIWFRFLVLRIRFFLLDKWFVVFHSANKLMFSRSASDLVHVVVLVINCYWGILTFLLVPFKESQCRPEETGEDLISQQFFHDQYNVQSSSPNFFCWLLRRPLLRLGTNNIYSNMDNLSNEPTYNNFPIYKNPT